MVVRALEDPSRAVRVSAVRLAERWLGEPGRPDPRRRPEAAGRRATRPCGGSWRRRSERCRRTTRAGAVVVAARAPRRRSDHAGRRAERPARQRSRRARRGCWRRTTQTPQRDAAVTMLAATIVRSSEDAAVQRLFEWAAGDSRPQWQRSALLRGAEVALLGATMPGSRGAPAPRLRRALPCPTCPGGRAGPGGAYAFSKPEDFARAGLAAGGRGGRPELRVSREPAALSALAASGGELSARAANGARARGLAGEAWHGRGDAADARRAAAVRRGTRDLPERLPGLPPARRTRPGSGGAKPDRARRCCLRRPVSRAHPAERQGGRDRTDAADRLCARTTSRSPAFSPTSGASGARRARPSIPRP